MNNTPVKEVFSEKLAETISRHKAGSWTIDSAMNTEWTNFEKNPPDSVDILGHTQKLPVTAGSTCNLVVQAAIQDYNLSSESEAVKRLARYGLPSVWLEWKDLISDAKQYEEAAVFFSKYSKQNPDLINLFQDKQDLKVHTGRSASGQNQWRIIWYQKLLIKRISDHLGIHQSDVLRRVIFEAGSELSLREQEDEIAKIIAQTDSQLASHIEDLKQPVYGALFSGLQSDRRREFATKCQSDFPRIWDDLRTINSVVAEEEYRSELETVNE